MRILALCRASTEVGLGHLIRSRAFALEASGRHEVLLLNVGGNYARRLLRDLPFKAGNVPTEESINRFLKGRFDVAVLDLKDLGRSVFEHVQSRAKLTVSLSPIFSHMHDVDLFFNRTKKVYEGQSYGKVRSFCGLRYAIVQKGCTRIRTRNYREKMGERRVPVALSMGGGDAANKTLKVLNSLKQCRVPAAFWVMLGEGYKHSYDLLMKTMDKDPHHEIILAKTNISMWSVLSNCILGIFHGGVTTFEAAYAGLPSVNLFEDPGHTFLVDELVERGACLRGGLFSAANLKELPRAIEGILGNPGELLNIHRKAKRCVDGKGAARILRVIERHLENLDT